MVWYKCPQNHIFECDSKIQHYYCSICSKIYIVKSNRGQIDVIRLIIYNGKYYEKDSEEGKKILSRQARSRARKKKRAEQYRKETNDHIITSRKVYRAENREHEVSRNKKWKHDNREKDKKYQAAYRKEYINRPGVRAWKKSREEALRGLALLGLGVDRMKEYREKVKLKKILTDMNIRPQCSVCNAPLKLSGKMLKCTKCQYWSPIHIKVNKTVNNSNDYK